jgi:hypothetical protein
LICLLLYSLVIYFSNHLQQLFIIRLTGLSIFSFLFSYLTHIRFYFLVTFVPDIDIHVLYLVLQDAVDVSTNFQCTGLLWVVGFLLQFKIPFSNIKKLMFRFKISVHFFLLQKPNTTIIYLNFKYFRSDIWLTLHSTDNKLIVGNICALFFRLIPPPKQKQEYMNNIVFFLDC